MQSNTIICNRDKFSLYSHFYKSMGFQVTFINGYFGNKGVLCACLHFKTSVNIMIMRYITLVLD